MQNTLSYTAVQAYATQISTPEPPLLAALRKQTQRLPSAQMLSTPIQGRILSLFSHLIQPQAILEISTYTGYSALCLAEGLTQAGVLHTIDRSASFVPMVKRYMKQAGKLHQLHIHTGKATEVIPTMQGPFDLVFIDADKKNYSNYYALVMPLLRPNGLLIADNVLWKGKVLDKKGLLADERAQAMVDFAHRLQADKQLQQICLPVDDGFLIARKK